MIPVSLMVFAVFVLELSQTREVSVSLVTLTTVCFAQPTMFVLLAKLVTRVSLATLPPTTSALSVVSHVLVVMLMVLVPTVRLPTTRLS